MAYNALIPQANDKLSTSQPQILANFTEINTYVNVDHTAFNAGTQGHHKQVFFSQYSADPVTAATECALYAKAGTDGNSQLFFRPQGSGDPVELSYALQASPGYCILPSGIYLQWGSSNMPGGNNTQNVVLPIAFPNAALSVVATPNAVPGGSYTDNILSIANTGLQQITAYRKDHYGSACSFNYLAIGY
jgi:hypothetical protein